MPQSNYIVFPSYNMVASKDRHMSEQRLETWVKNSNDTPHVVLGYKNEFNWLYDSGLVGSIDTGMAVIDGYTLDSGTWQPAVTLTAGTAQTPLVNHIYIFVQYDNVGMVKKSQIAVLPDDQTFPDNTYVGLLLWDISCDDTTVVGATDRRRFDAFDGTYGHKHTGAAYDGPKVVEPATAEVMGITYLSLDPTVIDDPIAIGLNEKGAKDGVAPLDDNTKIPWNYNYYFGPQGIFLLDDGNQNLSFGPVIGSPEWRIIVGGAGTDTTALLFQSMQIPATLYVYLLCVGGGHHRGDIFRIKERPEQIDWDEFPWCDLDAHHPHFPFHGWFHCGELAAQLRTLPYVANAWCECTRHFHKRIVLIATSTSWDYGTKLTPSFTIGGQGRGDIFHPIGPVGGQAGMTFLEHYGALDKHFPNTTVLGVGSDIRGSQIILDAARIVFKTGGDEDDWEHEHHPWWMKPMLFKIGGIMRNCHRLFVPDGVPEGGRQDSIYIVDAEGDGKTFELWTWKKGQLSKIG